MHIDEYGSVVLTEHELFCAIYSGNIKNISEAFVDQEVSKKFNSSTNINKDIFENLKAYLPSELSLDQFDKNNQNTWFMPEEHKKFPLLNWLRDKCKNDEELARVNLEIELFIKHNMFDLLFYLKYLVTVMRNNHIVWGVGRGSSVASYVLFLIGVHKINSLKYNLDIHEFLK